MGQQEIRVMQAILEGTAPEVLVEVEALSPTPEELIGPQMSIILRRDVGV
tara:strand:+ start:477 stop:626 length:150 start_codon:yes stop_codon:yes gene_type:complete